MVDPARRTGLLERTLGDISGCEISKADADSDGRISVQSGQNALKSILVKVYYGKIKVH